MKSWNQQWKGSKQPRKQRSFVYRAPKHVQRGFMGSNLAETLRTKYGRRSIPVRSGDKVKVMRGQFKGKVGKVARINADDSVVFVDGIELTKKDGTKITPPIHSSNLQILELELGDKKRLAALGRNQ